MVHLVLTFLINLAHAGAFQSPFLAFEMPENFTCQKTKGTYTCQSSTGPKMKDEIIVVLLKRAGPQDTLEQYRSQMSQPRTIQNKDKINEFSRVLSVQQVNTNGIPWIEAKHFNGELPDYYTSYWATKIGGVAMLISYSAHQSKQAQWQQNAQKILRSLNVNGANAQALDQYSDAIDGPAQLHGSMPETAGGLAGGWGGGPQPEGASTGGFAGGQTNIVHVGPLQLTKKQLVLGASALIAIVLLMVALRR